MCILTVLQIVMRRVIKYYLHQQAACTTIRFVDVSISSNWKYSLRVYYQLTSFVFKRIRIVILQFESSGGFGVHVFHNHFWLFIIGNFFFLTFILLYVASLFVIAEFVWNLKRNTLNIYQDCINYNAINSANLPVSACTARPAKRAIPKTKSSFESMSSISCLVFFVLVRSLFASNSMVNGEWF